MSWCFWNLWARPRKIFFKLQAGFKETKVELELLKDIDTLLMVEKEIWVEICLSINGYAKANNRYVKNYDKNEESSYLK